MAHESNFRPPLDMVVAPTSGRVESIVGIDTGQHSQPGCCQYVLTPAVH